MVPAPDRPHKHISSTISDNAGISSPRGALPIESDAEDESEESLFSGLNPAQKDVLSARMANMNRGYHENTLHQIIQSFAVIEETVTKQEAEFIQQYCHQHDLNFNDKINEEGCFFLQDMREMMRPKRRRRRNPNELNQNENEPHGAVQDTTTNNMQIDEDSDIDYVCTSSDDGFGSDEATTTEVPRRRRAKKRKHRSKKKKKEKKRKKKSRKRPSRLLLNDALKDTVNFSGWSAARINAWKKKDVNPNMYYYRFNDPGIDQRNGSFGVDEHKAFMERMKDHGVNSKWGIFSQTIAGRVGYQCSNYWRQLMQDGWVKDPNYWVCDDDTFKFKYLQRGSMPDDVRRYSFTVLKDQSGVFQVPGIHSQRPSNDKLTKYLQDEVKPLTEEQQRGQALAQKHQRDKAKGRDPTKSRNRNKKKRKKRKRRRHGRKRRRDESDEETASIDHEDELNVSVSSPIVSQPQPKRRKMNRNSHCNNASHTNTHPHDDGMDVDEDMDLIMKQEDIRSNVLGSDQVSDGGSTSKMIHSRNSHESNGNDADDEYEHDIAEILQADDPMTGEKMKCPAISPYGHVMEYHSWCRTLRDPITKNRCPFTQKPMTRRQLVKLNQDNIDEFWDRIQNLGEREKESVTNVANALHAGNGDVIACYCGKAECQRVMDAINSAVRDGQRASNVFDCSSLTDALRRIL